MAERGTTDDHAIYPHQIALGDDHLNNPYRLYVLPLSYENLGLLYAVLGLSASHLGIMTADVYLRETLAVEYRLKAIRSLGETIKNTFAGSLHEDDRDSMFAMIQILLLQDVSITFVAYQLQLAETAAELKQDIRIRCIGSRCSRYGGFIYLQPAPPIRYVDSQGRADDLLLRQPSMVGSSILC